MPLATATSQCDCSKTEFRLSCFECGCNGNSCIYCYEMVTCSGSYTTKHLSEIIILSAEPTSSLGSTTVSYLSTTTVAITAIISTTAVLIAVVILLTLAFYWRYRIRAIRER